MTGCSLGIDVGGGRIKALALSAQGTVLRSVVVTTPRGGVETVLRAAIDAGREAAGGGPVASVGVAMPGVVDMAGGRTLFLPNVPGDWEGHAVAFEVGRGLGAPCALLNDGRAAAFGELRAGAGRGCSDFVLLAVGTGIGGGIVIGGRLHLGATGCAGEVGHQTLQLHGPRCSCGNRGCGEALASGPALVAAAARAVRRGAAPALHRACGGEVGALTPALVAGAAAAGDSVAAALLERTGRRLGALAANLVVVLNPRLVLIGGGLAEAGPPLLAAVRRGLRRHCAWYLQHAPVEVAAAALGAEAGAVGAACWGAERLAPQP